MDQPATIHFKLLRFNPRRQLRGAPAAELLIQDDDNKVVLWMSEKDIRANIKLFGPHAELSKALDHYKSREEFR